MKNRLILFKFYQNLFWKQKLRKYWFFFKGDKTKEYSIYTHNS